MKKNRNNFPRRAANSNNVAYNQYVEDMYFADTLSENSKKEPQMKTSDWKKNGRIDICHEKDDSTDLHTVAEHYYERTTMPHGI